MESKNVPYACYMDNVQVNIHYSGRVSCEDKNAFFPANAFTARTHIHEYLLSHKKVS